MKSEEWIIYEQERLPKEALRKFAAELDVDESVLKDLDKEVKHKIEVREASK